MTARRGHATIVMLAVLALLVAACGTRLSEDERALYTFGPEGDGSGEAGGGSGAGRSSVEGASTRGAGGNGGAGAAGGGAAPGAGGGADPGGDGGDGRAAGAGPAAPAEGERCSSSGSGEKGVSDDTITLGAVSQLSGPVPGFARSATNGAQAYVAYVNANGGVCGRQLELAIADDGFDAARNAAETTRLEPEVLAFGGGFSVVDSGGAQVLEGTNITDATIATSRERQSYANNFTHLPGQDPGRSFPAPEWKHVVASGATKAIIVYVNAASARNRAIVDAANMEAAGLQVEQLEISTTQFSYAGPARAVRDSGAQVMLFISEMSASVQMVSELRKLDTTLDFEWYRIAYGQTFLERAGAEAENVVAFVEFLPFEEAGANEEMKRYQEWLARVAADDPPTFDSINNWIVMKLLVQAIRQIDGEITRDALLSQMKSIQSYDAGGLIHPMNPGGKSTDGCKVVVRVQGGRWVREAPASGFLC